jgi:GNAT superfamily N-acetyltransferase
MPLATFTIEPVRSGADLAATTRLFDEYAASLPVDLSYQDFAAELAGLPGKYAPPAGELLLARDGQGEPLGCVALRPIAPAGCCEMKRLYVRPRGRGLGLGMALVEAILSVAARIGYREMRLDSLLSMVEAVPLYKKAGFVAIEPYYDTPVEGTVFLGRLLTA